MGAAFSTGQPVEGALFGTFFVLALGFYLGEYGLHNRYMTDWLYNAVWNERGVKKGDFPRKRWGPLFAVVWSLIYLLMWISFFFYAVRGPLEANGGPARTGPWFTLIVVFHILMIGCNKLWNTAFWGYAWVGLSSVFLGLSGVFNIGVISFLIVTLTRLDSANPDLQRWAYWFFLGVNIFHLVCWAIASVLQFKFWSTWAGSETDFPSKVVRRPLASGMSKAHNRLLQTPKK